MLVQSIYNFTATYIISNILNNCKSKCIFFNKNKAHIVDSVLYVIISLRSTAAQAAENNHSDKDNDPDIVIRKSISEAAHSHPPPNPSSVIIL